MIIYANNRPCESGSFAESDEDRIMYLSFGVDGRAVEKQCDACECDNGGDQ